MRDLTLQTGDQVQLLASPSPEALQVLELKGSLGPASAAITFDTWGPPADSGCPLFRHG